MRRGEREKIHARLAAQRVEHELLAIQHELLAIKHELVPFREELGLLRELEGAVDAAAEAAIRIRLREFRQRHEKEAT